MRFALVVLAFAAALGLPVLFAHQAAAVPAAVQIAGGVGTTGDIDWP